MSDDIHKEIGEAYTGKDLTKVAALTGLPADVIVGLRVMSRKERRRWYFENRKRLALPSWDKLETLKDK